MGRVGQREGLGNKGAEWDRAVLERSGAGWGRQCQSSGEPRGSRTDLGRVSEIAVLRWTGGQGLDKEEVGKGGRWICRVFALGKAGFISVVPALVQNV